MLTAKIARIVFCCICLYALTGCGGGGSLGPWSVRLNGTIVEIGYGSANSYPQYAALHLDSSYFRMIYGPESGWGTSVILMPCFWEGGVYHQGTQVSYNYRLDGSDLVISLRGIKSGLRTTGEIRLSPPAGNLFRAEVSMTTTGYLNLDNRPGEAFKPVMLSSMHISSNTWDCRSAFVDSNSFSIPSSGWIVSPPAIGRVFGVEGGNSAWKRNAPTVEITLDGPMQVTGWVAPSSNPNDDNVGFWAASGQVLRSWHYVIVVKAAGS